MITHLILDTRTPAGPLRAGTPVEFLEFVPGEGVAIRLPNGQQCEIGAARVGSGINSPEETLSVLSEQSGVTEQALQKAAKAGRLMARKSGATWLSTLKAVEFSVAEGHLRGPSATEHNNQMHANWQTTPIA